jgi:hypothetical protein
MPDQPSPNDAQANLIVGRFECFARDDFEKGLPLLSKGSDPALKAAALADLAKPSAGPAFKAAGDAWWEQAATETKDPAAAEQCRARAGYWYRLAVAQLDGLSRTQVEKRLASLPEPDSAEGPTTSPGAVPPVAAAPGGASAGRNTPPDSNGPPDAPVREVVRFTHEGPANAVVFTPDGRYAISAGVRSGHMIRMWEIATGKEVRMFHGHTNSIVRLSISADGKTLASGSWDSTARTWNVETGEQTALFRHGREVSAVALSRDARYLIVGDFGGNPVIYDERAAHLHRSYRHHQGPRLLPR